MRDPDTFVETLDHEELQIAQLSSACAPVDDVQGAIQLLSFSLAVLWRLRTYTLGTKAISAESPENSL